MKRWGGPAPAGRAVACWLIPGLVMAVLASWRPTVPAMWADELATWGAVRLSWSQLWQLSGTVDAVLAPYYAAMKVYTGVCGTGTAVLRLPSAVAMVGASMLVGLLGRRVAGAGAGLLAGLLFTAIPAVARYAQEARPYAAAMFFAVLAVWCLVRLVEAPGPGRAAGCAGALAAVGSAHPLSGLLVVAGHTAAVLWLLPNRADQRLFRCWVAAAVVGVLPAALLCVYGMNQRAQVSWITLADVNSLQGLPQNVFASAAIGGLVIGLAVLGLRAGVVGTVSAGAAFVPPVLLLLAGTVVPVWVGRYVLIALAPLAVLAAAGAVRAGRAHAAGALAVALLLSWPVQRELREPDGHGQDSARIAEVIGPRYRDGDVAVFPDTHPSIPWAARDIYERYLPAPRPPDVLMTVPQRTDGHLLARECLAAGCLGTPPRIWVIRADEGADPLRDMAPGKRERLGRDYRAVQDWRFALLRIWLLERVPGRAG